MFTDRPAKWILNNLDNLKALAVMPLSWLYQLTDQQQLIDADTARWAEILWLNKDDRERLLVRLLYAFPEFRCVFYHRLAAGNATGALGGRLARHIWGGIAGLDLGTTPIGPGLFISHGQSTILSAESIGANLQVHQGVTVGWDYRSERRPTIGDDVFIGAGAKILGAVTVGNGARIGANAVVLHDVPAGATAFGVPSHVRHHGSAPG